MSQNFWQGKKVFITGHTGFKGSWLTTWLKLLGASVTGYALSPPSQPNLFELANVANEMTSICDDILNTTHLLQAIKEQRPDIVFHLAAQPLVHYSYAHPAETYAVNVMGTVHLLEAVRAVDSVRAVIIVTSDKCYENKEWVWGYRETDSMGGFDPYSSSKGCAELVVSAYRRSYFNPIRYDQHGVALASVRAGNVIGGGDWAKDRLVPDLIRSFINKEVGVIRNPLAYRPWQYILDVLQGYLKLAENLWHKGAEFAQAWNFGPHDENIKNVAWIADKVASLWGDGAKWSLGENPFADKETMSLRLDCNKSRALLGWEPKMTLNHTLENTVVWYLAHYRNKDMKKFTMEEIKKYENKEPHWQ